MIRALHVLAIGCTERDEEQSEFSLHVPNIELTHWVTTSQELRKAVAADPPDLILSFFSPCLFSGMPALALANQLCPGVPFIFISSAVGEKYAVAAMKAGAADYLHLGDLASQLAGAIDEALRRQQRQAERCRAEAILVASERLYRLAASTGDVWDWTPASGEAHLSREWKMRLGYSDGEVENTAETWLSMLETSDRETVLEAFRAHIQKRMPYVVEYRARGKAGQYHWFRATGQAQWNDAGQAIYMAGLVVDITAGKLAELQVQHLNRLYAVLRGISSLIVRVQSQEELFRGVCQIATENGHFHLAWIGQPDGDRQRVLPVAWSGAAEDYIARLPLGLDESDAQQYGLVGKVVHSREAIVVQDVQAHPLIALGEESLVRGFRCFAILPLCVADEVMGVIALYAGESGFFDKAEMKLFGQLAGDVAFALDHLGKSERLNYLGFYDALTGLPNRSLMLDRLGQLLHAAEVGAEGRGKVALVWINIDRFKNINDMLGRHAGDVLLNLVAERLAAAVGSKDRLSRVGSDQFAAILTYRHAPAEIAHMLSDQVLCSLNHPYVVSDQTLYLTFRVGVALHPGDGTQADTLMANAETASRTAGASEGRFQFYASPMNARVLGRLTLENKLRKALERNEFVLHYQPKISLQSGMVTGVEALLRWKEPEVGLVSPAEFVPILEDTGMIVEVGRWVLTQAVSDYLGWYQKGLVMPKVAVNVSAVQMRRKDFLGTLQDVLVCVPISSSFLDLELTESLLMEDLESNVALLAAIRGMGIGIAVDDFGTGYSSLSYLKRFPIDYLKIDQSFVREITTDPDAAAICVAIIDLAHNLKLKVIAEGVETEAQMSYLRRRRCDEVQGYFFSRPIPALQIEEMLFTNRSLALPAVDSAERKGILIVDDEPAILSSLRRVLRNDGYEIFTAQSAGEGFEILAKHEVQVVLSDQRMPVMNGTEFLSRVRKIYPDTVRMVLSGYADLESISGAVNLGAIYKFLTKPWDDQMLREHIGEAFAHHEIAQRKGRERV